jgi:putative ABC transport system ATP-binding protein
VPILDVQDVHKTYLTGDSRVEALRGVTLTLDAGDFVALVGPSGCGKSTLLHVCGAMDRPSAGQVIFEGQRLGALDDDRLTRLRRERVGFVFQFFNLLPTLTVEQNIALPLLLAGKSAAERTRRARELAARVGLSHRLAHFPQQLSGGEMQRAAMARGIVHQPAILIADEPTGNLDSESGARVLQLLRELHTGGAVTILLATHDTEVARSVRRLVELRDGMIFQGDRSGPIPCLHRPPPSA